MAMNPRVARVLKQVEALSPRERVLAIAGLPVLLVFVFEGVVFDQLRKGAESAAKQQQQQQAQLASLEKSLTSLPQSSALPAPDQLRAERDALQIEVDRAAVAFGSTSVAPINWSQVVRGSVQPGSGVVLQSLRTQAPELIFSSAAAQKAAGAASARPGTPPTAAAAASATPASSPALDEQAIWRHRVDLALSGPLPALLGYVQTLQRLPGDLRWQKLDIDAKQYPNGTLQLTLYTLSRRAETPFN